MGQKSKNQTNRKRQLNVVYFVDAARTRSFRIPLRRLNILLIFGVGIVAWSLGSLALVGFMVKDRMDVSDRLKGAMATIFEYETRYEGVYEKAYPADGRLVTPLAGEAEGNMESDPPTPSVSVNNASAASAQSTDRQKAANEKAQDHTNGTGSSSSKSSGADAKADIVEVSDPVVEETASAIELKFKIKNSDSPERVEGFVWAIASFKTDSGNNIYIGSPSTIDVGDKGTPKHIERAHRFSIRHYKRKNFRFPLPKDQTGRFTGIQIGVQYKSGGETLYNVPVDIQIGSKAETTPEADNKQGSVESFDSNTDKIVGLQP